MTTIAKTRIRKAAELLSVAPNRFKMPSDKDAAHDLASKYRNRDQCKATPDCIRTQGTNYVDDKDSSDLEIGYKRQDFFGTDGRARLLDIPWVPEGKSGWATAAR
jgi:hypothetical protein